MKDPGTNSGKLSGGCTRDVVAALVIGLGAVKAMEAVGSWMDVGIVAGIDFIGGGEAFMPVFYLAVN